MSHGDIIVLAIAALGGLAAICVYFYFEGSTAGEKEERERCDRLYKEHLIKKKLGYYRPRADADGVHSEFIYKDKDLNVDFSEPWNLFP